MHNNFVLRRIDLMTAMHNYQREGDSPAKVWSKIRRNTKRIWSWLQITRSVNRASDGGFGSALEVLWRWSRADIGGTERTRAMPSTIIRHHPGLPHPPSSSPLPSSPPHPPLRPAIADPIPKPETLTEATNSVELSSKTVSSSTKSLTRVKTLKL